MSHLKIHKEKLVKHIILFLIRKLVKIRIS